jgi:predicted AlkP superfamily pyrophosphatase or phosphodiesterase
MTLYFDQVDHAGHDAGPDAAETRQAIAQVDAALARLVHGLRRRGLLDRLNLVVVSDHGMAAVAADHLVAIEDMVSGEEATVTSLGQVVGIDPAPGSRAQVEAKLLGAHPQYDCWRKSELPERWHYGTHPRVPSIVCQMREGWQAVNASWKARGSSGTRGAHGFDPALPSMHALFVAHGPAFRAGTVLPLFDNVDVYPLLAQLLGIEPAANDGELTPLRPALQQP